MIVANNFPTFSLSIVHSNGYLAVVEYCTDRFVEGTDSIFCTRSRGYTTVNSNTYSTKSDSMTEQPTEFTPVESDRDRSALRELLVEFHEWMAERAGDIYDPDEELAEDFDSLADDPGSRAWVARVEEDPAGCVLLYGLSDELAEFRRLYVRPAYRGEGVGRRLVERAIDRARAQGYETLGLTTPPWSEAAQELYESMGFERTPPYPETRLPERYHDEAIFMRLDLGESEKRSESERAGD